jgi:putative membrane protein
MDVLSNLERIRNSPLPLAYSIHLRQTVLLYILTLPFQLLVGLGWATIPVVAFSAFTLLGIESIGTEIEQVN